jgi:hypothetical protein
LYTKETDLLFAANTPWDLDAERNFKMLMENNPDLGRAVKVRVGDKGDVEDKPESEHDLP